jgi:hypothetical protein
VFTPFTVQAFNAEQLREEVTAVLAPLVLWLAPEKTRVVHMGKLGGVDFLGDDIHRMRKRGANRYCVYTTQSKKPSRRSRTLRRSRRAVQPATRNWTGCC